MAKYYLDTLIWRDYYEGRKDNLRPLADWALIFLKKAIAEDSIILYSDFVDAELRKDYDDRKIKDVLELVTDAQILKIINANNEQIREAARISKARKVPFGDALHAVLARDNGAIVITRDKHFENLQDIAPSKKPEELI